jgi:hypothetical protein
MTAIPAVLDKGRAVRIVFTAWSVRPHDTVVPAENSDFHEPPSASAETVFAPRSTLSAELPFVKGHRDRPSDPF